MRAFVVFVCVQCLLKRLSRVRSQIEDRPLEQLRSAQLSTTQLELSSSSQLEPSRAEPSREECSRVELSPPASRTYPTPAQSLHEERMAFFRDLSWLFEQRFEPSIIFFCRHKNTSLSVRGRPTATAAGAAAAARGMLVCFHC